MQGWVLYLAGIAFVIGVQFIGLAALSVIERFHREQAARFRARNQHAELIEAREHADRMVRNRV